MTDTVVVVTGANGFVGARVCEACSESGAQVRALVRRAGTAPQIPRVTEVVGDFTDPQFASTAVSGATAVVSTVHPMGSDRATQHRVSVEATPVLARAAASAGVERFVHISTAAVYDRRPGVGDVDESSALVPDDAGDYAVTKRDTDRALAEIDEITGVILRPPAILGAGPTSVWNTVRPAELREDPDARRTVPEQTFAWVHVADLAALACAIAVGELPAGSELSQGPLTGSWVPINVSAEEPATLRDYVGAVTGALGIDPIWQDAPAWTGQVRSDRARSWGWSPEVRLDRALSEIVDGLS